MKLEKNGRMGTVSGNEARNKEIRGTGSDRTGSGVQGQGGGDQRNGVNEEGIEGTGSGWRESKERVSERTET